MTSRCLCHISIPSKSHFQLCATFFPSTTSLPKHQSISLTIVAIFPSSPFPQSKHILRRKNRSNETPNGIWATHPANPPSNTKNRAFYNISVFFFKFLNFFHQSHSPFLPHLRNPFCILCAFLSLRLLLIFAKT